MKKKILFSLLSILLIIILTPKGVIVEMFVTKGGTWKEPTLVAPFDIPLLKSSEQLEEDKKLVESSFEPIYSIDTSDIESITDTTHLRLFLSGIISDADAISIKSGAIRIADGASMIHKSLSNVVTVSEAENILTKEGVTESITPSLRYNEKLSNLDIASLQKKISTTSGLINEGNIIVSEGQLIDAGTQLRIDSYLKEYKLRMGTDAWWLLIALGRIIIVTLTLTLNFAFFETHKIQKLDFKKFAFIMGSYVVMLAMIALLFKLGYTQPYVIPISIIPILFLVLFNTRTAIVGNITISILAALFTQFPFEYFTVNVLAGMSAILLLQNFYHRHELFKAVAVVFILQIITSESFQLIEGYSVISTSSLKRIAVFFISNILLLGLYQLIYIIEKIFKFVSNVTLFENSDTNQPLLLELSHLAPGTFQHSVQVANLAEAAAKLVGANPLLARCGALYHDIGKMKNPTFYIENSSGSNPHDECTPEESCEIIKSHVSNGVEIANEHGLPECIVRFIATHHGNSVISYFYNKAVEIKGEENVDKSLFCYPGENPQTKEECICMICDTIEAAARSLASYDKQSIDDIVERLVGKFISSGHLSDSELTFEEVKRIKEMLKDQLKCIYHVRIAYQK